MGTSPHAQAVRMGEYRDSLSTWTYSQLEAFADLAVIKHEVLPGLHSG